MLDYNLDRRADVTPATPPKPGGLAPGQLHRAQSRLLADFDRPSSMRAIATTCGLSASHFSKAFRRSVGRPPHTWRMKQRVAQAKELMHLSDLTLADIAATCGFADQSHLNRVFFREVKLSPGAWRRGAAARCTGAAGDTA